MMHKEKVTISVTRKLLDELDRTASQQRISRSALVEEALRLWHSEQLKQELAEGYQAMAAEDRKTAEQNLRSGVEILD